MQLDTTATRGRDRAPPPRSPRQARDRPSDPLELRRRPRPSRPPMRRRRCGCPRPNQSATPGPRASSPCGLTG
eukprot:1493127-Pyramimonas_sp.AAC.1